jgi:Protein of unknown function (DUF2975)
MKSLLSNPLAIAVTLIICVYLFIVKWYFMRAVDNGPFPMDWSITLPNDDTSFGGIFFNPYINDSLPHYQYRKIEDSIKREKAKKELPNRSISTENRIGFIGAASIDEQNFFDRGEEARKDPLSVRMMDSLTILHNKIVPSADSVDVVKHKKIISEILWRYNVHTNKLLDSLKKVGAKSYYLSISNYMADHETKFFIENGKYNLAYVVYDSVVKRTFDSTKVGRYLRKEIKVRYSEEGKRVLIPLSKSLYKAVNLIILLLQWLSLALMVSLTIGLPIQILVSISKGQAFTLKNISRLRAIAVFFLIYGLIIVSAPFILHLLLRNKIPDELQLMAGMMTIVNNLIYFFIAAIVFILSVAFKRGYRLQQEQNLII